MKTPCFSDQSHAPTVHLLFHLHPTNTLNTIYNHTHIHMILTSITLSLAIKPPNPIHYLHQKHDLSTLMAATSASLQSIPSSLKLLRTTGVTTAAAPNLLSFKNSTNSVFSHKLIATHTPTANASGSRRWFGVKSQSNPSDSSRPSK